MESFPSLALGCLSLAAGFGYALWLYRQLPRSGYYNRREEKERTLNRFRPTSSSYVVIISLVGLGLALIINGLGS